MMNKLMILVSVFCLMAGVASAQTDDLLITEYLEGSGNNKALEIFNGTEDFIDLGAYTIERYSNGSTTSTSIPLPTVDLQPGDTWVVVHNLAEASLLALADQTDANLNFNGDDALVLMYAGTQPVDSFGRVGEDPGDYWACSGGNTQNHTLRRLSSICHGDTVVDDVFDACLEFSFFPSDTFSGIGTHIADCGAVGDTDPSWGSLKASFR
ncbi:MAG: lamin tail domain-containing protein [Candidatus Krumholzibacteriota bacterium]